MNTQTHCVSPPEIIAYFAGSMDCIRTLSQIPADDYPRLSEYLPAYGFTVLLEFPFYFWVLRKKGRFLSAAIATFGVNLATHPAVWYFWPQLFSKHGLNYGILVSFVELLVPIIEAGLLTLYFKTSFIRTYAIAVLANLFSWWVGVYLI
jgi:hypothetical protein